MAETTDTPKQSKVGSLTDPGSSAGTSLPTSAHDSDLGGKSAGSLVEDHNGGASAPTIVDGGGVGKIGGSPAGEPINQKANDGSASLLPDASK